ncbi:MAG: carboxypeptidase-like regulatory domain-containing protein, partial [Planctomycetota bacterium]
MNPFAVNMLHWTLPQGLDVTGRVVDASGKGVGGASLWVTTGLHRESRRTVATSNADGSFLLPQLQSGCFFGASSEEHSPSKPEHVQYWSERTEAGQAIELTLTLGEDAARVTGTVLDSTGQPAVGARVRLGPQSQFDTFGPRGAEGPPPPLEVLTDDEGRFAASGLAPGKVEWACQFDEHATQAGVVQVAIGSSADLQIRLDAGGYVRGRITDKEGRGLDSLTVASYQRAFLYPHPESSFDHPRTRTSSDGTFVLGPLAPGEVRLSASTPDRKGSCEATLEVVAGASYIWNDTILGLPVLTGRAVDRSGAGLEGWTVVSEAMTRPGPPPRAVFTKADGEFEMTSSGQGSVRLKLFPPDHVDHEDRLWGERRSPEAWVDDVA